MLVSTHAATISGVDAIVITVEVELRNSSLPGFQVVGMAAPAIREGGIRIRAALAHVGADIKDRRITVNLAPADLRKEGAAFDLPIALAILAAKLEHQTPLSDYLYFGELGLDGELRATRGALAAALAAKRAGFRGIVVPSANVHEARLVEGLEVLGISNLHEGIELLHGNRPSQPGAPEEPQRAEPALDMAEVMGQSLAKRAAEIAAAGGHNLLLVGPPGIGKTMLARRIPPLLPRMELAEIVATTKIYSALGTCPNRVIWHRPFRAPHHTASVAALIGGGKGPKPGEISLAHNGVLFLDELAEFSRYAIDSLRQPLEEGRVHIHRVGAAATIDAKFLLIAAANPCPCGWLGSNQRACKCSEALLQRYRSKLSGPILDRIDLHVYVPALTIEELRAEAPAETTHHIRQRILEARARQAQRYGGIGIATNSELSGRQLREHCVLDSACEALLAKIYRQREGMTARGLDRLVKVARTISDLDGHRDVTRAALLEAASFRPIEQLRRSNHTDIPEDTSAAPIGEGARPGPSKGFTHPVRGYPGSSA